MPGILNAKVEEYLADLLPKRDAVISEMERYAKQHDVPLSARLLREWFT